jgi:hypothetical protein
VKEKSGAKFHDEYSDRRFSMSYSIVPLLLGSRDISAEIRRALVEERLQDTAELLMQQYGPSCLEAGHLLDVSACNSS